MRDKFESMYNEMFEEHRYGDLTIRFVHGATKYDAKNDDDDKREYYVYEWYIEDTGEIFYVVFLSSEKYPT